MFGYIHLPETSPEKSKTSPSAPERKPAPAKKPRSGIIQRLLGLLDLFAGIAILVAVAILAGITGLIPWYPWNDDDK